jgi:hypothetical protein
VLAAKFLSMKIKEIMKARNLVNIYTWISVSIDQIWESKVKRKNFIRSRNRYVPYMYVYLLPAYSHRHSIRILRIKTGSAALAALPFCCNSRSTPRSLIYFSCCLLFTHHAIKFSFESQETVASNRHIVHSMLQLYRWSDPTWN